MGTDGDWRERRRRRDARDRRQDRALGDARFSGKRAVPSAILLVAVLIYILVKIITG